VTAGFVSTYLLGSAVGRVVSMEERDRRWGLAVVMASCTVVQQLLGGDTATSRRLVSVRVFVRPVRCWAQTRAPTALLPLIALLCTGCAGERCLHRVGGRHVRLRAAADAGVGLATPPLATAASVQRSRPCDLPNGACRAVTVARVVLTGCRASTLLQANVATGVVNLSMDTIHQPAGVALAVLAAYVCCVALGTVY
jgi:hypothetical protein